MREQSIEIPKAMPWFYGCSLTEFPLQFADIHRYIPLCSHSGSLLEKRLQAPALRLVPSFPRLREWDVTPTDYYGRMPPSVRVVLLLLGALSPNTNGALPIFGIVHARASGDSLEGYPSKYSPLPLTSLRKVPVFNLVHSAM